MQRQPTRPNVPDVPDDDATPEAAYDIGEEMGLDRHEVDAIRIILGALELRGDLVPIDPDLLAKLSVVVSYSPRVAQLLAERAWSDARIEPLMADIAAVAPSSAMAALLYVLAACAEARDDVTEAERLLRRSLAADPSYPLSQVELARFDENHGDYGAALRLLLRAGAPPDDAQRAWLETVAPIDDHKVGRNEPCPCGSGRKYKTCHLGMPIGSILDPASALFHKLTIWLSNPRNERLTAEIVQETLEGVQVSADMDVAAVDWLSHDILMFERGGLQRFLDSHGSLLPEREVALGREWLDSGRSLYQVESARPGSDVSLRDVFTGTTVELPDRTISRRSQPLDLLCVRLMPDGEGKVMITGGFEVPRPQRASVAPWIESGDGLSLLRWLAYPHPRIDLRNMDREPIVFVTSTYRLPDPDAARLALGRKLRDDGEGRYIESVVVRGQEWTRGSITIQGDEARIQANSVKRANRLERTLIKAAPGARALHREESSLEAAMEKAEAEGLPEPIDTTTNPDVADALSRFMREYEDRWVDEAIPALGGLTPREAARDRTARPELEALLDDMTWQRRRMRDTGDSMDTNRLRALLGIAGG
jgi:hypothetical protein